MSLVDLHGFFTHLKDHVTEHGFQVQGERHFVETYSNRQIWEADMRPSSACCGPLDVMMNLEVEARTLIAFECSLIQERISSSDLDEPADNSSLKNINSLSLIDPSSITVPLTFAFILPPLIDDPDLLLITTSLAGIGGMQLPLHVSATQSYTAVEDKPACTLNISASVDIALMNIYGEHDLACETLEKAHAVCEFLLALAPAWLH